MASKHRGLVKTHIVLKQLEPNSLDCSSKKYKMCERCRHLIAPDPAHAKDRYRSHNSRCREDKFKPYEPSGEDISMDRIIYDKDAVDRHGKPLNEENPVHDDYQKGKFFKGYYMLEEMNEMQYAQYLFNTMETQMRARHEPAETEELEATDFFPSATMSFGLSQTDLLNLPGAAAGDFDDDTTMSECSSELSRQNSLRGGGVCGRTMASRPSLAVGSTATKARLSSSTAAADDDDLDDEIDMDLSQQNPDREAPEALSKDWCNGMTSDVEEVGTWFSRNIRVAVDALRERPVEAQGTVAKLEAAHEGVRTALADLQTTIYEVAGITEEEQQQQQQQQEQQQQEEEEEEEEEEKKADVVGGDNSGAPKRSRDDAGENEDEEEESGEFQPEDLEELGEDALFMSQPDEVIDDEDEEQHQQAPPQQKLLRQSPRRSKRNRR
jgi:hypothetical protein